MTTSVRDEAAVDRYLDAVRLELFDLSPEERDELLEDLRAHLTEVASETDTPLDVRLGSPAEFAVELRAFGGFDSARVPCVRRLVDRLQRGRRVVVRQRAWHSLVEFVGELRPAWWVLRGVLAVGIVASIKGAGHHDSTELPLPPLWGNRALTVLALAVAIPVSVHFGRRARARGIVAPWRVFVAGAATVVLIIASFLAFDQYRALPEVGRPLDRTSVATNVDEMLRDVPLPPGLDISTVKNSAQSSDRYRRGVQVIRPVLCGWMNQWTVAERSGNVAAQQQALTALAGSTTWPVLIEMSARGDFPKLVWHEVDALEHGGPIPTDTPQAIAQRFIQSFGCK